MAHAVNSVRKAGAFAYGSACVQHRPKDCCHWGIQVGGLRGTTSTLRVDDPAERIFVLKAADLAPLGDVRTVEQLVQQVPGCKVWIIAERDERAAVIPRRRHPPGPRRQPAIGQHRRASLPPESMDRKAG
jgi:hypothetical protein